MKKLCALLLSVIMAASLTVPVFADSPDGSAPVEAVPINGILDASIGIIGGADGPTSIITTPIDLGNLDPGNVDLGEVKEALGGVAGQIGVMVNGKYIQFPDAAPEVADGRTTVPVRALVEALGGEVDYQDGAVLFVIDEQAYEFAVGSSTVKVRACDTGIDLPVETIEMDCAPYIKGGRTYVPIRFISEALGYEVGWDGDFQTAILLDREALAAEIDQDFTILNRVQANSVPALKKGESYRSDLKGSVTVTAFDTLNEDKTYKADFTCKALMNGEAASGAYSISVSDSAADALMELLSGAGLPEAEAEKNAEVLRAVLTGLKDVEAIMTREGKMWVRTPVLDELSGKENVWCGMDLGAELGKALFSETDAATVGAALAAMMDADSVMGCSIMDTTVQMMRSIYSDDKFTTADGTSTLTIGVDELMALYKDMGLDLDEVKDLWKEYSITMEVDGKGGATVACRMETEAQSGVPGIKMTVDCTQSGGKAELTMDLHVANLGQLRLTLNTTQQATGEKPMAEPPEGAPIMDMDAPEPLNP